MEKIGGGDQRYWSAKAATLNHSRRYLIKGGKKYLIGSGEQRCWSAKGCHPERNETKQEVKRGGANILGSSRYLTR